MGRVKIPLKKIENKTYKHITFSKRKNGIVKKAYELSILCDVEIALIVFSPAAKLILFDGKKRLEEILQSFLDLPEHKRECVHNQELIQRLITEMRLESILYHQFVSGNGNNSGCVLGIESQLEEIQNEIGRCNIQLEEVEKQLQYFVKSPNCIKSVDEAEYQEKILQETLSRVRLQKNFLEANDGAASGAQNKTSLDNTFDWSPTQIMNASNSEISFRSFSEIFQSSSEILIPEQLGDDISPLNSKETEHGK